MDRDQMTGTKTRPRGGRVLLRPADGAAATDSTAGGRIAIHETGSRRTGDQGLLNAAALMRVNRCDVLTLRLVPLSQR